MKHFNQLYPFVFCEINSSEDRKRIVTALQDMNFPDYMFNTMKFLNREDQKELVRLYPGKPSLQSLTLGKEDFWGDEVSLDDFIAMICNVYADEKYIELQAKRLKASERSQLLPGMGIRIESREHYLEIGNMCVEFGILPQVNKTMPDVEGKFLGIDSENDLCLSNYPEVYLTEKEFVSRLSGDTQSTVQEIIASVAYMTKGDRNSSPLAGLAGLAQMMGKM
jgi:hypothetical protein